MQSKVMISENVYDTLGRQVDVETCFNIIKNDQQLKKYCDYLRSEKDKKKRTEFKIKNLKHVLFQGIFDNISKKGFKKSSGIAVVDLDIYNDLNKSKELKEKFPTHPGGGVCLLPAEEEQHQPTAVHRPLPGEWLDAWQSEDQGLESMRANVGGQCQ